MIPCERKSKHNRKNMEMIHFTIVSGLISFGYNAVMMTVPLRMADIGLSYAQIGGAMSALAIGLMVIKLIIGHLSDFVGIKRFIFISLLGLGITSLFLANATTLYSYIVLLCGFGIFRGIFLAISGSHMLNLSEGHAYGKMYGMIQGVSSFLASIGGMISGFMYHLSNGTFALGGCGILFLIASVWIAFVMHEKQHTQKKRLPILQVLQSINKRIVIFCVLAFIQSFVAGPMWNYMIPMYCYQVLLFTPAKLGIIMSLDEFISSPTYMIAGRIVDKVPVARFNIVMLIMVAVLGVLMIWIKSEIMFILLFLLCSIAIACTFVGIPKARVSYINKNQKGFELALISVCASLGEALGSNVLGYVAQNHTIYQSFSIFVVAYVIMAIIIFVFTSHADPIQKK